MEIVLSLFDGIKSSECIIPSIKKIKKFLKLCSKLGFKQADALTFTLVFATTEAFIFETKGVYMAMNNLPWSEACERIIKSFFEKNLTEQKTSSMTTQEELANVINRHILTEKHPSENPWRMWLIIRRGVIEVLMKERFEKLSKHWPSDSTLYPPVYLHLFLNDYEQAMIDLTAHAGLIADRVMKLTIEDERLHDARSLTI